MRYEAEDNKQPDRDQELLANVGLPERVDERLEKSRPRYLLLSSGPTRHPARRPR